MDFPRAYDLEKKCSPRNQVLPVPAKRKRVVGRAVFGKYLLSGDQQSFVRRSEVIVVRGCAYMHRKQEVLLDAWLLA